MNEHLIERAFKELYPDKQFAYVPVMKYSGKFNSFNGNIRLSFNRLEIHMGKSWKGVSDEIQIGLIQSLMGKVFKKKINTTNIELYTSFLKNVHIALPKESESELLVQKFNKINEQFFDGFLDQSSLKWGTFSTRKLGHYEYGSDTIVLSKYLENAPEEMLEYVLYHEMLHKKHKFSHKNGRSLHHSTAFRIDEARFPRAEELEKEISRYISRSMPKKSFSFFRGFF
ncbi:MAG: SprT-like domain-containing protein [Candidatus Woesearchaeota archaeon]|jgi:hypothetical protein